MRTNLEIQVWLNLFLKAAPSLRRFAAGLASRRPCFDPRPVKVRWVLDQVAMGHISLRVLWFSSVSYYSSYSPYSFFMYMLLSYQKNKRAKIVNLQKRNVISEIGEKWIEKNSFFQSSICHHDRRGYTLNKCLGRNVFGLKVEFSSCWKSNGRKLMHRVPRIPNNGKYLNPKQFFDKGKSVWH